MIRFNARGIGRRLDVLEDIQNAKDAPARIVHIVGVDPGEEFSSALARAGLAPNAPARIRSSERLPSIIFMVPPGRGGADAEDQT